jgi:hypothetical protein
MSNGDQRFRIALLNKIWLRQSLQDAFSFAGHFGMPPLNMLRSFRRQPDGHSHARLDDLHFIG